MNKKIFVTEPFLPPLEKFYPYLEKIWESKHITNNGPFHKQLEKELCKYLGVKYISLISNGTVALLVAIKALELKGEIITTPYSFVATAHAIKWNGLEPVFIDIDPDTCNLNPDLIEDAITEKTTAILPVHVYGNPCETEKIQKIADKHNLKVIYDAAHAFGVKKNGKSILNDGDLSTLSFHATKVFNTFEGGAIVSHTPEMKKKINDLINFGFQNETTVKGLGINGKMNEVQSAMGLLQLKYIGQAIEKRKQITEQYRKRLNKIKGLFFLDGLENTNHNYAYFPIFINEDQYGISRDELYNKLKLFNIHCRRYFYPLISQYDEYKDINQNYENGMKISHGVLCLPIYPNLSNGDFERIIKILIQ